MAYICEGCWAPMEDVICPECGYELDYLPQIHVGKLLGEQEKKHTLQASSFFVLIAVGLLLLL